MSQAYPHLQILPISGELSEVLDADSVYSKEVARQTRIAYAGPAMYAALCIIARHRDADGSPTLAACLAGDAIGPLVAEE